jgi:AcrR family transcriptional regulator
VSAKRKIILDVAAGLFARYGLRKTSVADIIRDAGVARATVYKYFSSKEEIFQAVIDREIREMLRRVREEAEKQSTTRDRLRAAVQTHTAEIQDRVNVHRLTMEILSDIIPRTGRGTDPVVREALNIYEWILSEGVKAGEIAIGDVETTARSILLAFKGVFVIAMAGHMEDRTTEMIETLLDLIWNGLRPREEAA